jgi:magnesium transporter
VIVLPLTLIAGVFGMNVAFPGEGTHDAFWVVVGVMIAALIGMVGFFFWKKWL